MTWEVNGVTIRLVHADITEQNVDAVVNAANKSLMGGGGVDGAIHEAAGEALDEACMRMRRREEYRDGVPTGDAVITTAGDLPADNVIHTVGPMWRGGDNQEAEHLEMCYRNSLQVAVDNNVTSLAFPAISTGAYNYPLQEAAEIALETTMQFLQEHNAVEEIRFVLFSADDLDTYREVAEHIL